MAFAFITDAYDKVWKIALLGVDDALHMLPSYEEVHGFLSDLGLEEQIGLCAVIMEQPMVQVAMGRMMGLIRELANTKREVAVGNIMVAVQGQRLNQKDMQIEALKMENANFRAAAFSDLAACQATIGSLQQQLQEANAQGAMPGATQEQGVALAIARSKQTEAERTARDMAATAAAAEQKSASLEAALEEQEDVYENEVACLTMQLEQAQADATTAKEAANADAWNSKKLWERLQRTEAERDSLAAALTAQQQAGEKAERWLAFNQRVQGDHVGLLAQQNPRAREAMVEENRILRFRLAILEQQLRHASTAAAPASPTSARICSPVTPADPAAVASSGTGGASAGASEQTNSQAAEATRESLLDTLRVQEELQRRQSVATSTPTTTSDRIRSPVTPADPPAAAYSGTGGASAGAPEHTASQAAEVARNTMLETLSVQEELQGRRSVAADMPTSTRDAPSPATPAGPPAAASPSTGGASAGASEQSSSQEEERHQSPELHTPSSMLSAAPAPASSISDDISSRAAASQQHPVKKPSGLMGAVISGAALAAALTEVTFKTSTAAAGYMWTSAARTLIPAF